jgi:hypothetical protein
MLLIIFIVILVWYVGNVLVAHLSIKHVAHRLNLEIINRKNVVSEEIKRFLWADIFRFAIAQGQYKNHNIKIYPDSYYHGMVFIAIDVDDKLVAFRPYLVGATMVKKIIDEHITDGKVFNPDRDVKYSFLFFFSIAIVIFIILLLYYISK